jgi:hypothetical protein
MPVRTIPKVVVNLLLHSRHLNHDFIINDKKFILFVNKI